jgi:hypothetical protein
MPVIAEVLIWDIVGGWEGGDPKTFFLRCPLFSSLKINF